MFITKISQLIMVLLVCGLYFEKHCCSNSWFHLVQSGSSIKYEFEGGKREGAENSITIVQDRVQKNLISVDRYRGDWETGDARKRNFRWLETRMREKSGINSKLLNFMYWWLCHVLKKWNKGKRISERRRIQTHTCWYRNMWGIHVLPAVGYSNLKFKNLVGENYTFGSDQ